jgi:hypothetical protein
MPAERADLLGDFERPAVGRRDDRLVTRQLVGIRELREGPRVKEREQRERAEDRGERTSGDGRTLERRHGSL